MKDIAARCHEIARTSLDRWAEFAESDWYTVPDDPSIGCYGTGFTHWGVQTNQKYAATMGVLSAQTRSSLQLERALASLRHGLRTHITGDRDCTSGDRWGCTWITVLGLERLFHGIDAIENHLTEDDRERLKGVVVEEANYLTEGEVYAGRWNYETVKSIKGDRGGLNRPESNIWNGATCARAAAWYPDHPNASVWLERAHCYFINGISVPSDADLEKVVSGKPVRERYVGANFFEDYALDHHGYLNVGYMVICLSNIAMFHYGMKLNGHPVPESAYHHAKDLWDLVKRLMFANGRLARIGGDSRVRYCYCQDYIIPTLIMAADVWKDEHALQLLEQSLLLAKREQDGNSDGSFLGTRLSNFKNEPYYFSRLESDRAVAFSFALHWLPKLRFDSVPEPERDFEEAVSGGWHAPEHGAALHRSPSRLASWSWRAADQVQGLCLPPDGALAEWRHNLSGGFQALGGDGKRHVKSWGVRTFDGGFLTWGQVEEGGGIHMRESFRHKDCTADRLLVAAALPDGRSMLHYERFSLRGERIYLEGWQGLKCEIPNDVFNGYRRGYSTASGEFELTPGEEEELRELDGSWVCVDGKLALVAGEGALGWKLWRRDGPIGGGPNNPPSIRSDAICLGGERRLHDLTGPVVLIDQCCQIVCDVDAKWCRELAQQPRADASDPNLRDIECIGFDGRRYRLVVPLDDSGVQWKVPQEAGWRSVGEGPDCKGETLALKEPCLFVVKG